MSDPATYIVRREGALDLRFSAWGVHGIPVDLLVGPDAFLRFIKTLASLPEDDHEDFGLPDGAVLVDFDQRLLAYCTSYSPVETNPAVRRAHLTRLSDLWPDWTIRWAHHGLREIARLAGGDELPFRSVRLPPALSPEKVVSTSAHTEQQFAVIIRTPGGPADYGFGFDGGGPGDALERFLKIGPGLVEIIMTSCKTRKQLPREDQVVEGAVLIDPALRTIDLAWLEPREGLPEALSPDWPDWSFGVREGGYASLVELTGRDPAPLLQPASEATQILEKMIREHQSADPGAFVRSVVEREGATLLNPAAARTEKADPGPGGWKGLIDGIFRRFR
jgi:hypothetical protein